MNKIYEQKKPSTLTWLFFYTHLIGLLFINTLDTTDLNAQQKYEKWSFEKKDKHIEHQAIKKGIDYIYNLQFVKAKQLFSKIISKHPNHPVGYFYDGMVDWWKIMIDLPNEKYDEVFEKKMDLVIEKCDHILLRDRNNYEGVFYKCAALGFRGRLRANRKKWIKAAGDAKDALPLVERLKNLKTENNDVKFGLGLYNYYADAIPEKYPVLKPITVFLPKGNKQKGIQQLIYASKNATYASTEALYFLSKIYFSFEKNYLKANEFVKKLHHRYPKNTFFYEYLARTYYSKGDLIKALTLYQELLSKIENNDLVSNEYIVQKAHFFIGKIYQYKSMYHKAVYQFEKCEAISLKRDVKYITFYDAHCLLEKGKMYDMLNKREMAIKSYKQVLNKDDINSSHELAEKYLNKPYKR